MLPSVKLDRNSTLMVKVPLPVTSTAPKLTLRLKTHAAPTPLLSFCPPITKVEASPDIATELCRDGPLNPLPVSTAPCWLHVPLLRVKIQAPPAAPFTNGAPSTKVLPSVD